MTVSNVIDDAHRLIESRLAEIKTEADRLHRALESLRDGTTPTARSPRRAASVPSKVRRRVSGKPKSRGRAARGQRREELLTAIKADPGARPSELAKTIGIKPAQVHALITKARAEKLIVKKGKGYALKG
jgi:predicted Rossmann fold nucleotide-binding protein DprA/Smf involved in DNA uptake